MVLLTEVLIYLVGLIIALLSGFMFANFQTRGLVWTFTKVRMFGQTRGWVVLKVHTISRPYYRVGKVFASADGKSMLRYIPRNNSTPSGQKTKKILTLRKGCIQTNLGVDYAEVDEETNNVLDIAKWNVLPGHDAEAVDALYTRIAMLPKSIGQKELIILICIILVLLISIYTAWKLGQVGESVDGLQALVNSTRTIPANVGNLQ